MSGTSRPWLLTSPGRWVALYFFSVVIIAALKLTGAIESPVGFILLAAATCLLLPLARRRSDGCISRAMADYNRRIVFSSLGYVLGLGIAVTLWNSYQLSDALVFAISLLPTVPTFGIIWAMAAPMPTPAPRPTPAPAIPPGTPAASVMARAVLNWR